MKAVIFDFPFRGLPLNRLLPQVAQVACAICAITFGRGALEQVHLPKGITNVSGRARRLIRQSQISAW